MIRRLTPALLFLAASLPAQTPVKLYTDLGTHQKSIGSKVPEAQNTSTRTRLVYGFNHAEAIRSFTERPTRSGLCKCWWESLTRTAPRERGDGLRQRRRGVPGSPEARASAKAHRRGSAPTSKPSRRYAAVPPANRASLDSAYSVRC